MEVISCSRLLVQSCCREGGALQTNVTGLCGEHSQCSSHTGFALAYGCVLSLSTLLRLPAALYGAGPALHAVPVFRYSTKARARLGLRFVPSPALAAQAARSLTGTLSLGAVHLIPSTVPASVSACTSWVRAPCVVSILGSWPLAATLLADVDHPEYQEVFDLKLGVSLQCGRGCHLWDRVYPFPLPLASCLWWGMGWSTAASSSLVFTQSFVLGRVG